MIRRAPTGRPQRLAELLRERLALILLHKCADPRLQELTLTRVEVSPDLKHAKVYYETRPQADETKLHRAIDKAMGFIKQEVARENIFRLMPEIVFLPDKGLDETERLERLFHEAGLTGKRGEGSDRE